ncbi:Protein trichome birefringence [Bienertia sinuspersici]
MELNSTIKDTWKFFTIASLLSFLIILVFLSDNRQNGPLPNSSITLLEPNYEASAPSAIGVAPVPSSLPPIMSNKIIELEKPNNKNIFANATKALIPQDGVNDVALINEKPSVITSTVDSLKKETTKIAEKQQCNIFDGRWVYKADTKPSYCSLKCPFVEDKMNCQRNERPDFEYEKWVWEAKGCDIPLLNGTDMVERFRNKRVIFVGDSLNRNMWESLACLLYSSIPIPSSRAKVINEDLHIKTFLEAKEDYNFTVEFYWSPFLVQLDKNHTSRKRVLVLDKLSPSSKVWSGADIMIFNSAHHWPQIGKKKAYAPILSPCFHHYYLHILLFYFLKTLTYFVHSILISILPFLLDATLHFSHLPRHVFILL